MTVFVQGDEKTVTKFIESIKSPPPPTLVRSVEKRGKTRPKLKHFEIRVGRLEDELLEGFGAMQIIFNDYRIEFRDFRQDFNDFVKRMDGFAKSH